MPSSHNKISLHSRYHLKLHQEKRFFLSFSTFMTELPVAGAGSCLYEASIKSIDSLRNQQKTVQELTEAGSQLRAEVIDNSLILLASNLDENLSLFNLDQKGLKKRDLAHHRKIIGEILEEWRNSNHWTVLKEPKPSNELQCYVCKEVFKRQASFDRHQAKGHTDSAMLDFESRVNRSQYLFLSDKVPIFLSLFLKRPILIFRRDESVTLISINQYNVPQENIGPIFGILLDLEHYSGLSQKSHFKDFWKFLQGKFDPLDFFVSAGKLRQFYHEYAKNLPEDIRKLL